jgi:putative phosphoserine phosphatase/1-acylglycerol-3-phosphate O-acyltransferase
MYGSGDARIAWRRARRALRRSSRGLAGVRQIVRTGAALAGFGTVTAVGAVLGLLNRDRRRRANVATSLGCDVALALAGVRLNVVGEQHLWSQRPAVFIFNHQSSIDVAVVGSLLRRDVTGVACDPRAALLGYLADVVYVDGDNTVRAKAALAAVVERLREGVSIAIAPEGTRSPTPRPGRFEQGAFHMAMQGGVPIVAIVIRNAGEIMWKGSLVIRPGTIDVAVLPPITAEDWTVEQLDERIAEVRRLYLDTLESWPGGDHRVDAASS